MVDIRDTAIRDDDPRTEIANLHLEVASLREQNTIVREAAILLMSHTMYMMRGQPHPLEFYRQKAIDQLNQKIAELG